MNLVKISAGNTKLGKCSNVSLIPVVDCGNCEDCRSDCYALKSWRMYPSVRDAWGGNSRMARRHRAEYFQAILEHVLLKRPERFRWHVAGDVLDQDYLDHMIRIAERAPGTKFLAFTKMHDLDFGALPKNLKVYLSMWPGMRMPDNQDLPKAWLQDGTEGRVPKRSRVCPGSCTTCHSCWTGRGKDVVFHKH